MDGQQCPTSTAQQLRVVQQLLWDVISLHLYPAERDEIRRALGSSLLDENEAMFAEAGALADILGDVQLNTSALLARHQLCSNPQRSMVESEIRLLIDRLHASATVTPYGSATVRERDPDSLLPRSGKRDKAVLEYVTTVAPIAETGGRPPSSAGLPPRPPTSLSGSSRPGTSSRPPTALSASASITLPSPLSRPGTASPTLLGSRPSTASSAASSAATRYTDAPSVLAGVADKLSVASIEAVRDTLRTALQDERAALLEDIEYLQGLLEAETDLQVRAAAPPPSLAELKDYSSRLAAVVADEEARVEHEVRVSAMFAAADQQQSKAGRLRGMVDASRRPTSSGSTGSASASAGVSMNAVASPAGRAATAAGGGSGSGGPGSVQTLVIHGSDEDSFVRQSQAAARPAASSADGTGAAAVAARSSPLPAVRRPGSSGAGSAAEASPLPPVLPPPTAALRPPGVAATAVAAAASLPAVRQLPGSVSDPLGRPGNNTHRAESNGTSAAPAADGALSSSSSSSHSVGPGAHAAGRLRQAASPGRALHHPASGTGAGAAAVATTAASSGGGGGGGIAAGHTGKVTHGTSLLAGGSPATGHARREPSPARAPAGAGRVAGTAHHAAATTTPSASTGGGHRSGSVASAASAASSSAPSAAAAAAAAGMSGLRPLGQRSGSAGAVTAERRHVTAAGGGGGNTTHGSSSSSTAAARGTPAGRAGNVAATSTSHGSSSSSSSTAAAAAVRSSPSKPAPGGLTPAPGGGLTPGTAVAARLASAARNAAAAAEPPPMAVQPRALLGNKQSLVEQLDAEVDAVKGGVAAILERYNLRPSTPTSPAPAVPAAAAAGAASGAAAGASRAVAR